jgi:hypothetical protein
VEEGRKAKGTGLCQMALSVEVETLAEKVLPPGIARQEASG